MIVIAWSMGCDDVAEKGRWWTIEECIASGTNDDFFISMLHCYERSLIIFIFIEVTLVIVMMPPHVYLLSIRNVF